MKRKLSLILAGMMLAGILAACSGGGAPPAEQPGTAPASEPASEPVSEPAADAVKITIWHEADATIADTLQQQLDSLAPAIEVTLERKEQMSDALKLAGNDPSSAPDMYFWAHDKIGVFAAMNILAPVTDVIDESELADLLPMSTRAGTYEGNIYQLPLYFETLLFMYNKALMDQPPATTDELLEKMRAETTDDMYVFVEQHSTAYNAACWMQGFGGFIINGDRVPGLNAPGTVEALSYHTGFVPYMPADGEYNTVTTLFSEGMAMSTTGGPWLVPGLKDAGIELGIAPMPTLPNGNPLTPFSGVQGVQVLRHAAEGKAAAAAEVLRVLLQPETGIAVARAANCAPVNTKAYDDAEVAANEMVAAMRETADNVVPMPNIPEMDVMWGVTDTMLAAIHKNNGDVQTEADRAQQEALSQIEAMQ